jgi:hypothetical protein
MTRSISAALAAAVLLTLGAGSASAAQPVVHTPAIAQSAANADLIQRASNAVREYLPAPISNLWVFPTGESNTVFVRYTVETTEHLLLVEMSGARITTLRDFTTPATTSTPLEANAATEK